MRVVDILESPNIICLKHEIVLAMPDDSWANRWLICLTAEEAAVYRALNAQLEAAWPHTAEGEETVPLFVSIVEKLDTFFKEAAKMIGWLFDPVILQEVTL